MSTQPMKREGAADGGRSVTSEEGERAPREALFLAVYETIAADPLGRDAASVALAANVVEAVVAVLRERLTSDEAVEAAKLAYWDSRFVIGERQMWRRTLATFAGFLLNDNDKEGRCDLAS
jgi:hypothetical protein